jgi:hypothetical protein
LARTRLAIIPAEDGEDQGWQSLQRKVKESEDKVCMAMRDHTIHECFSCSSSNESSGLFNQDFAHAIYLARS